ncbi:MAG: hypothetical protein Q4C88_01330 [Akkermansia sp.]|nr:hypothetical protein [Akkermansia sp.]
MSPQVEKLHAYLNQYYQPEEWPTLLAQAEEWAATKPLEGLRILDATPLFRNTLAKHMALLAGGALVYVPQVSKMPTDPAIFAKLDDFGIGVAHKGDNFFDIVLDCSGQFSRLKPKLGFAELTRSGVKYYEHTPSRPVLVADAGRIKRIETSLGTGESFFRAMQQLGYDSFQGRRLLVAGYGKVGRGIVLYALKNGMKVTVADVDDISAELPDGVAYVNANDTEGFNTAASRAWCLVTATGVAGALRRRLQAATLATSAVMLANMGVEDEFGAEIPESRVLNKKRPLNFILEEPTAMRYIETTMALHNACALELLTQDLPHKCMTPPQDVEDKLLSIAAERGTIGADIRTMLTEFK